MYVCLLGCFSLFIPGKQTNQTKTEPKILLSSQQTKVKSVVHRENSKSGFLKIRVSFQRTLSHSINKKMFTRKIHILHNPIEFGKVIFISIYPIYLFCCVWLTLFLYFSFSLFLFGWFPTFHNWDLILHVHTIYSILVYYRPFHIIRCVMNAHSGTPPLYVVALVRHSRSHTHIHSNNTHSYTLTPMLSIFLYRLLCLICCFFFSSSI